MGLLPKPLRRVGLAVLAGLLAAGAAYATAPGWHRALTPGLFGMTQAAPGLYVDDPARAAEIQTMIDAAEARTATIFGPLQTDPVYIVCTTLECAKGFGLGSKGLIVGHHIILISPPGMNPLTFTHERIHAELHGHMDIRDLWDQRFPAWFDEGLASHLSGDDRLNRPENPRDADWIRSAQSFRDWSALPHATSWRDTYGAAARLVQEIEETAGRDGLLALIDEVAGGADFDDALAKAMSR